MVFTANTFIPQSSMANSNAPRQFSYRSATDNIAAIIASGYFDDAANITGGLGLKNADIVLAQATDGTRFLEVAVSGLGVVTIALSNAFV